MLCKMKKLNLLLIMTSCVLLTGAIFPGNLFAETVIEEWVARYNGPGNGTDWARAIAVDTSGNVYVTGSSVGSGTGADYATVKYDTNGNELWIARYDGPANGGDYAYAIAVDTSGNIYVTGNSHGGSGTAYDYATVKYDTDGNQLWVSRYDGPADPQTSNDRAYAIAVDTSGNVYVTGISFSFGSGTEDDFATVKYDTDGNELWVARYNGPGNGTDWARAIAVDTSGNVYVTGFSCYYYDGGTQIYDYATVKYDTDGNQLWVARYDGPGNHQDYAWAIAVDTSGNVYVTGESVGSGSNYPDYATVKYDTNGNELWVSRYDGPRNYRDSAYAIAVDSSGNVYVTGGSGSSDYATVKYDTNGNELWVSRYNGPGNHHDYAHAIAVDTSGNVYVTGESYGSTEWDYATVKYDTDGNQQWGAMYNGPANYLDYAHAIAVDTSGNVYVTGESVGSGTGYDYATIKYSQIANQAPVADAGENIQITSADQAYTVVQGTATDPDADPLEYRWLELEEGTVLLDWTAVGTSGEACLDLGTLPYLATGNHTLTLEISDGELTISDEMVLTIENSPPEAQPNPISQVVEIGMDPIVVVAEAADFDGDTLSYEWLKGIEVLASGSVQTPQGGEVVPVPDLSLPAGDSRFPLGVHQIELKVSDGINDPVSAFVSVEVIDTTAPSLGPIPSVTIVWPPNHELHPITIYANAFDNGGGMITLAVAVQSSEPPDTDGDGTTMPDYYIDSVDNVTGLIELWLRAERQGKGDGRTYTITITATDETANQSVGIVEILAPHDRRKK